MVKKGQDLQQIVELKLEKKNELIVEDHRNQEIVIIENIVEDPLEVKDEDESITHNPQIPVDLLKTTTQYVDFLGVEYFNFIINPFFIDVTNKLKVDENKFYATLYEGFKFQNWIKLLKHSKYLFIWSGRFQISRMNSRTSLFQVEGSDVGQNILINFCNLLYLVFLCNFRYFRFRTFISLFFLLFLMLSSQIRVLYAFVATLGFLVALGFVFTI